MSSNHIGRRTLMPAPGSRPLIERNVEVSHG